MYPGVLGWRHGWTSHKTRGVLQSIQQLAKFLRLHLVYLRVVLYLLHIRFRRRDACGKLGFIEIGDGTYERCLRRCCGCCLGWWRQLGVEDKVSEEILKANSALAPAAGTLTGAAVCRMIHRKGTYIMLLGDEAVQCICVELFVSALLGGGDVELLDAV